MKKHDLVIWRAVRACPGYVVRVGKDWADVEWHAGIGCTYRQRTPLRLLMPISGVLDKAVHTANATAEHSAASADMLRRDVGFRKED